MSLVDGVSFVALSGGTGAFAVAATRKSFRSPDQAIAQGDLTSGATVAYLAQDSANPTQRCWGHGTYTSAGGLTRDPSERWVNAAGAVGSGPFNFPTPPIVSLTALASDFGGGGGGPVGANPTATAGPSPINGTATTFMRSDAAPAVQIASNFALGLTRPDNTTITQSGGVLTAVLPTVPVGANPTATAKDVAVPGSAATFMRSDAAPAVQLGSATQKGIVQVDGTSITAAGGVISAPAPSVPVGANPTAVAGSAATPGAATTFMRSDAAPAVRLGSATQTGLLQVDGATITASSGGVISVVGGSGGGPVGANPTATAGPVAINGSAGTFMRSDAAPAVQLGTAAQKGIVQVDGTTIIAASGVISAVAPSVPVGANPTALAGDIVIPGVATTFMRSDAAPPVQKGSSSQFGIVKVDGTTIVSSGGVISAVGGGGGGTSDPLVQTISASSPTLNVNYAAGQHAIVNLAANVSSFSVSNFPLGGYAGHLTLEVRNTGAYDITWPPGYYVVDGTPPTVTSGSGARDLFELTSPDGGSTVYVAAIQNYIAIGGGTGGPTGLELFDLSEMGNLIKVGGFGSGGGGGGPPPYEMSLFDLTDARNLTKV